MMQAIDLVLHSLLVTSVFLSGFRPCLGNRAMSRLVDDLFKGYNPVVWPRVNSTELIHIQVGLGTIAVVSLDTKDQTLNLCGYITAIWKDEYLQWDPGEYGNITRITLLQDSVWKPDITLARSLDTNIYIGSEETRITVTSGGRVMWQPAFNSHFTCKVDVTKFPLDVNICPISLGTWMHNRNEITLTPTVPHTVLEPGITNGEFDIAVEEPLKSSIDYDGESFEFVHFRLKLSRKPAHTVLSLLMPMFVIGLLTPISFLIPADNTEKVDISLNILLATAVCIGVVSGNLPERSDEISSVAVYVVFMLMLSFLGVLANTVVLLVRRHDEANQANTPLTPSTASQPHDQAYSREDKVEIPRLHVFADSASQPSLPGDHKDLMFGVCETPAGLSNGAAQSSREKTGQANNSETRPMCRATKLNWLFFAMNIFGLTFSFLTMLVQITS